MLRAVFLDVRALLYGPQGAELLSEVLRLEGVNLSPEAVAAGLSALPDELRQARLQIRTEAQEDAYHRAMLPALLRSLGIPTEEVGDLAGRLAESVRQYPAWWSMYPETLPVLEELKRRGLILGVVANWEPSLQRFLAEFELDTYFRVMLSSMAEGAAKPDPLLFRRALDVAGCQPGQALHCGPSIPEDVEGALAAGMAPVWINRTGISTGHEVLSVSDLRGLLMLAGKEAEMP